MCSAHQTAAGPETRVLEGFPERRRAHPALAVIMPVYNEVVHVNAIIGSVLAQSCVSELVLVDDGSSDGSFRQVERWANRDHRVRVCRHLSNRGKGAAIRSGLALVRSEWAVIQDADLEYDPSDYDRMLAVLRFGGADVVYGSRFLRGHRVTWRWHYAANWILTRICNHCTGLHLTDAHTCLKMLPSSLLKALPLVEDRFGFCAELTARLARVPGLRLQEVPISYRPRQRRHGKKIGMRDGVRALFCYVKYGLLGRWLGEGYKAAKAGCADHAGRMEPTVPPTRSRIGGLDE